ncbi:hypothetical protein NDU88_006814 [Pleurodeles waltl]|uniref:Uncharacterized protein n=1 Tax=Pleurodeles waltl TaxID=8319 RepID=A0AAV7PSC6_PLEWA|nr:hypothetical protein NDU88_006814 [Pleurodeles waltl]
MAPLLASAHEQKKDCTRYDEVTPITLTPATSLVVQVSKWQTSSLPCASRYPSKEQLNDQTGVLHLCFNALKNQSTNDHLLTLPLVAKAGKVFSWFLRRVPERNGAESRGINTDASHVPERSGAEQRAGGSTPTRHLSFCLVAPAACVYMYIYGRLWSRRSNRVSPALHVQEREFSSDKYRRLGSLRSNLVKSELLVQEADFWGGTPEVFMPLIASIRFIGRGRVWRRS